MPYNNAVCQIRFKLTLETDDCHKIFIRLSITADWAFGKDGESKTQVGKQPVIIREQAPTLTPEQHIHIHQNAPQIAVSEEKQPDFAKRLSEQREQQARNIVLH